MRGFLDDPGLVRPLLLLPWAGVLWSLLGGTRTRRLKRATTVLGAIAVAGLFTGLPENPKAGTTIPYMLIGMFGSLPVGLGMLLAYARPTKDRRLVLSIVGGAITLGALTMCGLLFALFSWASDAESLRAVQSVLQPVPFACAILGRDRRGIRLSRGVRPAPVGDTFAEC